jgi:hypothetical protein
LLLREIAILLSAGWSDDKGEIMSETVIGSLFVNEGGSAPNLQIVPTTANIKGIHIRTCTLTARSGTVATIFANASLPASVTDQFARPIFTINGDNTSTISLPYPLFVPPGLGLWIWGTNANYTIVMTYDLGG